MNNSMNKVKVSIEMHLPRTIVAYTVPADVLKNYLLGDQHGFLDPFMGLITRPGVVATEMAEQPAEDIVTIRLPMSHARVLNALVGNVVGDSSSTAPRGMADEVWDALEGQGVCCSEMRPESVTKFVLR